MLGRIVLQWISESFLCPRKLFFFFFSFLHFKPALGAPVLNKASSNVLTILEIFFPFSSSWSTEYMPVFPAKVYYKIKLLVSLEMEWPCQSFCASSRNPGCLWAVWADFLIYLGEGGGGCPIFCKGLLLTLLGAVQYITAFGNSVILVLLESFLFFSKICSTYYKITR